MAGTADDGATDGAAPRAVLWDMDGTLFDSGDDHFVVWREILGEEGYVLTPEAFLPQFGRRNLESVRAWLGDHLTGVEIARIADGKEARWRALVTERGLAPLPGVVPWLERLAAAGWRQAVASSATPANIAAVLAALGLERAFDVVVSAEALARGKPEPDVFLAAAAAVGVPPARCVVVEDAPAGVEAGRRAGMRVVGVGPQHAALPADLAVPSLEDLAPDAFERLVGTAS